VTGHGEWDGSCFDCGSTVDWGDSVPENHLCSDCYIATLEAQAAKDKAEIENLHKDQRWLIERHNEAMGTLRDDRDEARAEIEKLRGQLVRAELNLIKMRGDDVATVYRERDEAREESKFRASERDSVRSQLKKTEELVKELEEDADKEAARWQKRIAKTIEAYGIDPTDAGGCYSGDPLDWSDTQIRSALCRITEEKGELELDAERDNATILRMAVEAAGLRAQSAERGEVIRELLYMIAPPLGLGSVTILGTRQQETLIERAWAAIGRGR
jgi:hypothetical protein